jgi:hypothetical protein
MMLERLDIHMQKMNWILTLQQIKIKIYQKSKRKNKTMTLLKENFEKKF